MEFTHRSVNAFRDCFDSLELELKGHLPPSFNFSLPDAHLHDQRYRVSYLTDEIKKHHVAPEGRRLSWFGGDAGGLKRGELSLTFTYKSKGLVATRDKREFSLVSSGQSAILALGMWLRYKRQKDLIYTFSPVHVGVRDVLKTLSITHLKLTANSTPEIVWICSGYDSVEDCFHLASLNPSLIVVDTTCWDFDSDELDVVLSNSKDAIVVSFRSNSKLDMGGVEYGSIGSIEVHSDDPGRRQEVFKELSEMIKLGGGPASVDDVPPYFLSQSFVQVCKLRSALIRDGANYLVENLDAFKTGKSAHVPPHKLYVFLKLGSKILESQLKGLISMLILDLKQKNVSVLTVPSFGFNNINITIYRDEIDQLLTLRICPSPLMSENELFVSTFNTIARNYGIFES